MITIKDFMEAIQYKPTEGSEFLWTCYGPGAYSLDYWNGVHDGGVSVTMVFDTGNQTVYEMQAWDYSAERSYRWIHPDYVKAIERESEMRGVVFEESIDGQHFIDLEVPADILEKATAMVAGVEYDKRVMISIELSSEEETQIMRLAHEADMSLNQFMEFILRTEMERNKRAGD
jgi:hypothetical protein